MQTLSQIYVGVDVSKDELVVAYPQAQGGWVKAKITNELADIFEWLNKLELKDKFFILEHTGPYSQRLIHALDKVGATFSVVNPIQSRSMAKLLMKTNKTDDQDAQTLSQLGQTLKTQVYRMPSSIEKNRKEAFSALVSLQKQEGQLKNQLHAFQFLVDPNPVAVRALEQVLHSVRLAIADLEAQIKPQIEEAQACDLVKRISSVKGIGQTTAEALVTLFGDFSSFECAKAFAKFLGLTPSEFSSGKSVRGRRFITKKGNSKIRGLLFNCARSAMNHNPTCKALYQRIIAKEKNGKIALTAVMHKLARIVFGVVKSGRLYDPNFTIQKKCV
ncbi:IS110 family transposase [Haliscomenobacter hydrossis]|uniref:Transposase IS116/IS110/IS902 family protein n=1 Tax=Haliscomenobacter hydrossis (strain ATCC 27775 / DSM 1100 / LMG 10767 / O) TaxID=760192 RepID=F4KWL8_HALH1|nr:IS110 family transposase [Haliscomenobacter hydrossis]AEE51358.1 transposase IS116/IS110/IS902 family protein [Haliscomenobacter hydrossis DSM 1100]